MEGAREMVPAGYGWRTVIDLHAHVLPAVDDGPRAMEGSLALARAAVARGTTELAATPHVTWDLPTRAAAVHDGVRALQAELDGAGIPLRLHTGGELAVAKAVELDDAELAALRLGGGEWLLLECPLRASAAGFEHAAVHVQRRGHRVLLAHPERSPLLQRDPRKLAALVAEGMLVQLTAGSLAGAFGGTVQAFALDLLGAGLAHVVASDAHDAVRRPPGLLEGLRAAEAELPGALERAAWLTEEVPRAIVAGGPVPQPPGPPPRRRRRGLLRGAGRRR